MGIIRNIVKLFHSPSLWEGLGVCFLLLTLSCSKDEEEAGEWDNWQQRNEAYFQTIVDCYRTNSAPSLAPQGIGWKRLKVFSKDETTEGDPTDYVYAYVIEEGTGTESPAYTDSVRVAYRGRIIPSDTYPEGFVFDSTVYGDFELATSYTAKMLVSANIDGFCTALQYMHRGDRWRIYIPQQLGYGAEENYKNNVLIIPSYSVLIFDLQLVDFSPAGETMPAWSAREK